MRQVQYSYKITIILILLLLCAAGRLVYHVWMDFFPQKLWRQTSSQIHLQQFLNVTWQPYFLTTDSRLKWWAALQPKSFVLTGKYPTPLFLVSDSMRFFCKRNKSKLHCSIISVHFLNCDYWTLLWNCEKLHPHFFYSAFPPLCNECPLHLNCVIIVSEI